MNHPSPAKAPLRTSAGAALSNPFGAVRVAGPDRMRLLQALVTNDVSGLEPGTGCRSLLLDHKGRVVADLAIEAAADAAWLLTEGDPQALADTLGGYILADDVELAVHRLDRVLLAGPGAAEVLGRAGLAAPEAPWGHGGATAQGAPGVLHRPRGGTPVFEVLAPAGDGPDLLATLVGAGAAEVSLDAFETLRIEARDPRWGRELTPEVLALEVGLDAILHRTKGCYVGQETVVRGTVRGQSRWTLAALGGDGAAPIAGAELRGGGRPVGQLTSVAPTGDASGWVALARIRREASESHPWEVDGPDGPSPARPLPE